MESVGPRSSATDGSVLFAGGGTGGHLFPGIAVAREVARRHPTWRVVFVGSGRAVETRAVGREGYAFERVRTVGLVGKSLAALVKGLATLPLGMLDAWRVLRRYRPKVVVGLGGYSSGPVVMLAALTRVPTMLLEQNVVPGVTNRLLAPMVRASAVTYEASLSAFGRAGFVSGNPVRTGFFDAPDARSEVTEPHIVVLGGSQGAHALNVAMVEIAPSLASLGRPVRVTHQAGEADVDDVRDGYRRAGVPARVQPFFEHMDEIMAHADVVVCRAGATTLAELAAAGRPAILVPYPHATHDHQRRNAAVVREAGAAVVIDPCDLSAPVLLERLRALTEDDSRRRAMASASRQLGRPDATAAIVDRLDQLASPAGTARGASASPLLRRPTRVHLVGIGGIGMSGIAQLLVALGHRVTGSDLVRSRSIDQLESLGVVFTRGHDAANLGNAELVVASTAVPPDNPERMAAAERGIPVVARGAMLAELSATRQTVAVAGSHGKTTTSSMVAVILDTAGLDPTAAIGGRLTAFGSNARLGSGPLMVVEADESDRSFLLLDPAIAVLTNIDDEHLEAYSGMEDLEASFLAFAERTAPDGCVVACIDDPRLTYLTGRMSRRVVTYGVHEPTAQVRASAVELGPAGSRFTATVATQKGGGTGSAGDVDIPVTLSVPGEHNIQNALAAIAVAVELGVPTTALTTALTSFTGAERRFQRHGSVDGVVVVDDYAHHPTEIAAVLKTARLLAPARLRVVFQPHRYSRTLRLLDSFAHALSSADDLFLTEIYAASEPVLPGATSEALAKVVKEVATGRGVAPTSVEVIALAEVVDRVTADSRPGDLIVTLGAGSIGTIPAQMIAALRERTVA